MEVTIGGRRIKVNTLMPVGKGGEADIYKIDATTVLKLFKPSDHPDYEGNPHEQKGASERLKEHQRKLRDFPKNLPQRVIVPLDLALTASNRGAGEVCGYTMRFVPGAELLIRLGQRDSRLKGISSSSVVSSFKDLHATVHGIHSARVVVGDFNDLNGLVKNGEVHVIDADSMQFGPYYSRVFTQKFVDPTLCDPKKEIPLLCKPHNSDSDWYAYATLLMQSLLFVGPYGGVFQPKVAKARISHDARPMHRITVFHPEVRYPKPAQHWSILPDELLQLFHQVFEKDQRGVFPINLLDLLDWKTCPKCSLEHARFACPVCQPGVTGKVRESIVSRGTVKATTLYMNKGIILAAAYQGGKLCYVAHDNGAYRREDGTVIVRGGLDPQMRVRICGTKTLLGKVNTAIVFDGSTEKERITVEANGTRPLFDTNDHHYYFARGGQLHHDADVGHEYIGDILPGQTLFWTGSAFGFGFYWAGRLRVGFVFDAKRRGLNDTVRLPPMRGQLIDTACYFSKTHAWFLWSSQEGGRRVNQCIVVRPNGLVEGHVQAEEGDGSWLGTIHGKCATGNLLLCATDDGIIQMKHESGQVIAAKQFPDTEPFVSSDASLLLGSEGLYVITGKEITLLKIT